MGRATTLRVLGEFDAALKTFARVGEVHAAYAPLYLHRGMLYLATGESERAMRDVPQAVTLDPSYAEAWRVLGHLHLGRGDLPTAEEALARAVDAEPQNPLFDRGSIRENGDRIGAAEDYPEALRLAPEDWPLRRTVEERLKNLK